MNYLTTENFIKKAKEKFGDKFDYSKVECYHANDIVTIICERHGEFKIKANKFLKRKYGCPKCSYNILTTEEFIKQSRKIHGNKYDYSKVEYTNSHAKVIIICPKHGEFKQIAREHLKGQGCPRCKGKKHWDTRGRITTEDFVEKYKKLRPEYDYSLVKYEKSNKKIKLICPMHGVFEITPNSLQQGSSCPKCSKRFMNTEYFIEQAKKIHGDKYDYSKVEYKGKQYKVCIICPEHGEFWQTSSVHLRGGGCPKCKMSHLENEISQLLKNNNINFQYESNLDGLLKRQMVDFYLTEYNLIIECQGGQHFYGGFNRNNIEKALKIHNNVLERDIRKHKICEENNIKILYYTNIIDLPNDIFFNEKYKSIYNLDNFFTNKEELLLKIKKVTN